MTSLLEKFISVIAPHRCILCSKENNVVCTSCALEVFAESHMACYMCSVSRMDERPCASCAPHAALAGVWIAGTYDAAIRTLVHVYKFSRVKSASIPLAAALDDMLPYLGSNVVVVPVPTAWPHIRVRGYDHTALLARELARRRGWRYEAVLRRRHNLRQVGASKTIRAQQANTAFEAVRPERVQGATVVIVDDVVTSGATLAAASRELQSGSPSQVVGVVIAKHILS